MEKKMKKTLLYLLGTALALVSSGSALAYSSFQSDVNDSCGYEVITDCSGCHDTDKKAQTAEKDLYMSEGACGFCTENLACNSAPPTEEELLIEARAVTLDYFTTLFSEFMSHLNGAKNNNIPGNPFAEVFPACPEIAPEIASDKSRLSGYLVRRVTERTRNSRNIPDDWELQQLRNFNTLAANKDPSRVLMQVPKPDGSGMLNSLEYEAYEVVMEADVRTKGKNKGTNEPQPYFRYVRSLSMPPMPVAFGGPEEIPHPISGDPVPNPNLPCLLCHGNDTQVAPEVRAAIEEFYPFDQAMDYVPGEIRGAWSIKIPLNAVPQ
jgi:hypothetical protein